MLRTIHSSSVNLAQVTDADYVQRTVIKAIKNDIVIAAMHTNLDSAVGGVNYKIAEKLGLKNPRFFGRNKQVVDPQTGESVTGGDGVIGEFEEPLAADDLILLLKKKFDVECVRPTNYSVVRYAALLSVEGLVRSS